MLFGKLHLYVLVLSTWKIINLELKYSFYIITSSQLIIFRCYVQSMWKIESKWLPIPGERDKSVLGQKVWILQTYEIKVLSCKVLKENVLEDKVLLSFLSSFSKSAESKPNKALSYTTKFLYSQRIMWASFHTFFLTFLSWNTGVQRTRKFWIGHIWTSEKVSISDIEVSTV